MQIKGEHAAELPAEGHNKLPLSSFGSAAPPLRYRIENLVTTIRPERSSRLKEVSKIRNILILISVLCLILHIKFTIDIYIKFTS